MRVRLLHFLHYFSLLPPHLPAQKSARASNAGAPNMRPARLALRLEPCMARTQDVGQRGRTTIDVVLLHFLHYFLLLHPIFPAQKSAGASNAAAPNIRHARLCLGA